jgi:hypothetical protein
MASYTEIVWENLKRKIAGMDQGNVGFAEALATRMPGAAGAFQDALPHRGSVPTFPSVNLGEGMFEGLRRPSGTWGLPPSPDAVEAPEAMVGPEISATPTPATAKASAPAAAAPVSATSPKVAKKISAASPKAKKSKDPSWLLREDFPAAEGGGGGFGGVASEVKDEAAQNRMARLGGQILDVMMGSGHRDMTTSEKVGTLLMGVAQGVRTGVGMKYGYQGPSMLESLHTQTSAHAEALPEEQWRDYVEGRISTATTPEEESMWRGAMMTGTDPTRPFALADYQNQLSQDLHLFKEENTAPKILRIFDKDIDDDHTQQWARWSDGTVKPLMSPNAETGEMEEAPIVEKGTGTSARSVVTDQGVKNTRQAWYGMSPTMRAGILTLQPGYLATLMRSYEGETEAERAKLLQSLRDVPGYTGGEITTEPGDRPVVEQEKPRQRAPGETWEENGVVYRINPETGKRQEYRP